MDAIRLTSLFKCNCNEDFHYFTKLGEHFFEYTSQNVGEEPNPDMECNCGQYKWKDLSTLKDLKWKP